MNNKGSITNLFEGIVLSLLFVVVIAGILTFMNGTYGKNYSTGLNTSGLDTFYSSVENSYDSTGGEVEFTTDGLTLSSSWKMVKGIFQTLWSFINGSWINDIITGMLKIDGKEGATIALVLRVLFLMTLVFALIALFFKVQA